MGKSKRKTPIIPNCGRATSEKAYKKDWHRAYRHACKIAINNHEEPPDELEFYDSWNGPKDGKSYIGDLRDEEAKKKMMRK